MSAMASTMERNSPSTTRSATMVPVAAVSETRPMILPFSSRPRWRIMYGRTSSPMRNGSTWMAAKPIQETASTRIRGTSANERRRKRQRTARK